MSALLLALGVLASHPNSAQTTSATPLICPQRAPANWGVKNAPLASVRVLSFKRGETESATAPPTMAPTSEKHIAGLVVQSWLMNVDAPTFEDKVDCLYSGTDRYLRLDAADAKTCTAKWRPRPGSDPTLVSFQCSNTVTTKK